MSNTGNGRRLATWQIIVLCVLAPILLGGAALLAVGLGGIVHYKSWEGDSVAVTGTVVANKMGTSSEGNTLYYALVEYPAPDGKTEQLTDSIGQFPGHDVGDKLTIRYKTDDPQGTARIWSFVRVYLVWTILAIVGGVPAVIAIVAAVLILVIPRRRRPASPRIA
jgi:hypothetical protein